MKRHPLSALIRGMLLLALLCAAGPLAIADVKVGEEVIKEKVESEAGAFRVTRLVRGLEHPWAVAWLPDGRMLVTERLGRLHLIDGKTATEIKGLPKIDSDEDQLTAPQGGNQGGLLDVVVHPNYKENGWIYFTYSSPGDDDAVAGDDKFGTGTALARARLAEDGKTLEKLQTLYAQSPRRDPGRHYGSRIVFPGDGTVLFTIGDRGLRHPSQDLTDPAGSVIRLKEDGGAADGNPFINVAPGNLRPEIYSYGHRNNQGLAINRQTGDIWTTEHGPSGGDLLHRVQMGKNYGWPQVAYGADYSTGEFIGIGREAPGVERPVRIWDASMAPSGLAYYDGAEFDGWSGNLFAGFLLAKQVSRLVIEDGKVTHEEALLKDEIGRIRDVRQGPDGLLYVVTDEKDGGIYRLEPVK